MKTKIFEIKRAMRCTDAIKCSDDIIEKLKPLRLVLRADKETDIVNGYVSCSHDPNNHLISIGIYEENQNPNEEHKSTFEKPITIPSRNQLESLLT